MNSGTATATAVYHLRPVHDTHSPPPEFIKPTTPRQRRPLSPTSLRDVDLTQAPEGLASRKFPPPPTGHDLMAMFPPAPPEAFHEMRPGPTSGFFQKQERAFFAKAGKEIVRVHVEVDFPHGGVMAGPEHRKRGRSASSAVSGPGGPPIVGTGARPWLTGPAPQQHMQQQQQPTAAGSAVQSPVAPSPVPSNGPGPYAQHGMGAISTPATSSIHPIPATVAPGPGAGPASAAASTATVVPSSRPPSHRSASSGGMYPPTTGPGGSPTTPTHHHAPHPHAPPPPHHAQMMPPPPPHSHSHSHSHSYSHPHPHAHRMPPPPDPMVGVQQGGHPHPHPHQQHPHPHSSPHGAHPHPAHSPHAHPHAHHGAPPPPPGMHTHSPPGSTRDSPPGQGAPPGGAGMVYDDEAWRKPTPFGDRRRAGKHTRRVIVKT